MKNITMAVGLKLLLLNLLYSLGCCCPEGWQHYENSCITVVNYDLDYASAEEYCSIAQGTLLKSQETEVFISFYNAPGQKRWVETDTNKSSTCDAVRGVFVNPEPCSNKLNFVCERNISTLSCPMGFNSYNTMCLRIINTPVGFAQALRLCQFQQGKLAVFDNLQKEKDALALIIGTNKTFLVGVRPMEDYNYTWINGADFKPDHFKLTLVEPNSTQTCQGDSCDCLGFRFKIDDFTFESKPLACDDRFSFICEAKPLEPTLSTTTTAPLVCPPGLNWKIDILSSHCFWETTYETERLNWFQAREYCQKYGGDLASYNSDLQETIGLSSAREHYGGLWIGLERDEHNVFRWTDGTPVNFSNWNTEEPNLKSKTKFCVTHSPNSARWQLDYCGVRRWFVCKAPLAREYPAVEETRQVKTRCSFPTVSVYGQDWYQYEDYCYMVNENKHTWDTGRIFCQDNGAQLASIHSFNETNFLLNLISRYSANNYWIGLSALGLHSSYKWSDHSPYDFLYWADETSEENGPNVCVSFNKRDGSWDNEHCNRLQNVICKRGFNATYDFTTAEPTFVMPGNCENGWYSSGNKCYKWFGKLRIHRVSWKTAKEECENIGATLTSIHSQAEQDFLTDVIFQAGTDLWIGLQSTEDGNVYHWADDSRMDYVNWAPGEPERSGGHYTLPGYANKFCVVMEHSELNMGKWNDVECSDVSAYLCEKPKNPEMLEPYQDPFSCPNISGWSKLRSFCYGIFEQSALSWLDAQAECRKFNANLVTFRSSAESLFLKTKLKRENVYFWIGVREKERNTYESITGMPLFFTNWLTRQPSAASQYMDNCVAMSSSGKWLVKSCKEKLSYMCKAQLADDTQEDDVVLTMAKCDDSKNDWYSFGGDYCYMPVFDKEMTWGNAMQYCFRHGGSLASFHSLRDVKGCLKLSAATLKDDMHTNTYLHIGLGHLNDGSFGWVDGSAVDFTNWRVSPEGDSSTCVTMSINTGEWRESNCELIYGFICSSKAERSSNRILTNSSTDHINVIAHKLTVGGIFGIIICLLVIFAIAGVTAYYLWPTKEVQPSLLETESL